MRREIGMDKWMKMGNEGGDKTSDVNDKIG